MGLNETIKELLSIAQKVDNIDLYRKMLDLEKIADDIQTENKRLKQEIKELKKQKDIESKVERHQESYITFSDDEQKFKYCSHCWDSDRKIIQLKCSEGEFRCPHCNMRGRYKPYVSRFLG